MNNRQLILFTILLIIIASLCRYFDTGLGGVYEGPNMSMYAWGISPIFMTLVFRIYNKDWKGLDIKPNFSKSWKWYVLSILGIPFICMIQIIVARIAGNIEITENFSIPLILNSVVGGFGLVFLKNISEEFTWRGYLTYSLNERGMSRIQNHLIVGSIWILWHVPYLGRGINFGSGNIFWISVVMWIMACLFLSVIYGEIRLRSKTVWTIVLLHTLAVYQM